MRMIPGLFLALLVAAIPLPAQKNAPTRDELLKAMNETATYASTVLLDENGKSRCDYSMLEGKWYDYEPAWHTGQIINGLVEVYKVTKNESYLTAAKKAGDWWIGLEIRDNPKLNGFLRAVHGDGIEFINLTTITDGSPGLFNLSKVSGEKKYAAVATKAGQWALDHLYLPREGVFYDLVDPNTGAIRVVGSTFGPEERKSEKLEDVTRVNNEGSIYKDMFEFTGDAKYRKVCLDLCESLLRKQGPEGLWMQYQPNNAKRGSFHPRFNIWYAEALIEGYTLTKDQRYLDAAKKTLSFYTKFQQKDGTIYYVNYLDGSTNENSVSGSTVAMAGLMWLRLRQLGVGAEFEGNIEKSIRWILENRFAPDHPDTNVAGAVVNIRYRSKGAALYYTQRDLGTSFAMRFLAAYYNDKFGNK